jgi:two-component system, NtrC family, sensor kinase
MQELSPGNFAERNFSASIQPPGLLDQPAARAAVGEIPAARALAALQAGLSRFVQEADLDGLQAYLVRETSRLMDSEGCAVVLMTAPDSATLAEADKADGNGLDPNPSQSWLLCKTIGRLNPAAPGSIDPLAAGSAGNISSAVLFFTPHGPGLVKECLRSGQPAWSNDIPADPRYDPKSDGMAAPLPEELSRPNAAEPPIRSMLCAPLSVNAQPLGVVQVFNQRREGFNEASADLLSLVAIITANAIQSVRLLQELKVNTADLEASRWELQGGRNTQRALFDHLPFSLYIIDTDYRLAAINKNRAQRSGQPAQALVGQTCYQALFGRPNPCPECRVRETFNTGRVTHRSERRTISLEDASEWEIQSFPVLDEDEQAVQAVLLEQDNTERRHLEAILTQSEKLAAIGQLAAGVAHEINNPLTAIIANAQILHRELPDNSDLQESVDLIARAGGRAAQVVRNLLDFARKEEYHLGLTDVNETMERALELVQHELLAHGVRLQFDPDANLPLILASQDHLQSVWLNLLLNAIDSMDKTPGEVRVLTRRVKDEIQVSVADNGKGISPERLRRIFEPFYTTKAAGRGTGLGLSVSHRIVKQHNGSIRVESQVGVGSTFTVILPTT